jgi:hypothetical protein
MALRRDAVGVGAAVRCGALVTAALVFSSCGGRSKLVPAHQLGYLTDTAVVASEAGVRIVVRTEAWAGPSLAAFGVVPIQLIVDNGSSRSLDIAGARVALVTKAGHEIDPWQAPASTPDAARDSMHAQALPERVLEPNARLSGFVFFVVPDEANELEFRMELVEPARGQPFARIEIPFSVE